MLLALDVDVVAITEVVALAAASYVDEAVHGAALAKRLADVTLGFFHGDFGGNDQLDVEVLGIVDFSVCSVHCVEFELQR